jgi:uncharacterized membrane protein (UPF0127 family)
VTATGTVGTVPSTDAPPHWLVRDAEVLAAVEVPVGRGGRARGLLGREGVDGVMLLRPCRNVHTFGMRFAIDVAFCDRDDVVLRTVTLVPWRVSPLVWRSAYALETRAGAFSRWGVRAGDRLELRS